MNLAIIFNAGGLGDTVMTLPLFFFLKKQFKSKNLVIDVYTHLPYIYNLFKYELPIRVVKVSDLYYSSPFKDLSILRKKTYDYLINLVLGKKSLIQTLFFKSNHKIFYIPFHRIKFNILFPYFRNYSCKEPSFLKYKKIAEAITGKEVEWIYPRLKCNQETLNKVKKLINYSLSSKIVFINPFVKGTLRNLPIEFYINLISSLKERNYIPILVGGKDAISIANLISKRENIKNLTGRLSIEEFICLLNFGNFFITPDSGPMHMAFLSKIKVIPIFNFLKPEWRIPSTLIFKRVYPIYTIKYYLNTDNINISSCWTEKDQKIVKEIYPYLEEKIKTNPIPIIEIILNYLETSSDEL